MELIDALKVLQASGERDSNFDESKLGELAGTSYWEVLKESIIQPKIASLYQATQDISKVLKGDLDIKTYGEITLFAFMCAGYLQDIIDIVESRKPKEK